MSLYRFECLNHFIGSKIEGLSVCDCCLVMFEMFLLYMIAFVALITCQKTKMLPTHFKTCQIVGTRQLLFCQHCIEGKRDV